MKETNRLMQVATIYEWLRDKYGFSINPDEGEIEIRHPERMDKYTRPIIACNFPDLLKFVRLDHAEMAKEPVVTFIKEIKHRCFRAGKCHLDGKNLCYCDSKCYPDKKCGWLRHDKGGKRYCLLAMPWEPKDFTPHPETGLFYRVSAIRATKGDPKLVWLVDQMLPFKEEYRGKKNEDR